MNNNGKTQNETTAEEILPLSFRVLWWRALVAIAIGGLVGWAIATFWCYTLGKLLFPSVFPAGRGMVAANMSVGLTMMGGALLGLVAIFARGTIWVRAFASVIGVWLGCLVFFMGALCFVFFSYFLLTKIPVDNQKPPLTAGDLKFSLWTFVPMLLSGGCVLLSVYKMHVGNNVNWLQTTKQNIRENSIAIFKPNEKHRLERFVLQSPLSIEECRARLPQIAKVETSPFAFWEKWPLPGLKPLTVKVKSNSWHFTARSKRACLTFHVDLIPSENGTQFLCVSHWIPVMRFNLWWNAAIAGLIFVVFALAALVELFAIVTGQKTSNTLPFFGFVFILVFWIILAVTIRLSFWHSRQQELMAIEAMQEILEVQIIERGSVRYKWGLIEQS